jgi:L-amino acid N-acyltransferase YncA
MELLQHAERRHDDEHRAVVIARDGTVVGLALFGMVAGAVGVSKVYTAVVAPSVSVTDVGERIIAAVIADSRRRGDRLVVAELPDDPVMGQTRALLSASGFAEEGRIPDYFRNGIALTLFRREL